MARSFVSKFDYPRAATAKDSFIRNLVGGMLGIRSVHSDFRRIRNWQQAILSYVIFFFINLGLVFLFFNLFLPGVLEISGLWVWVPLLVILHLIIWLLRITLYHALCKIAKGTATIKAALVAGGFTYPLSSVVLATLCIVAFFVNRGWTAALIIPTLLLGIALLWRAIVIIRGASALYNIPKRNTFIMLIIILVFLGLIAVAIYSLISNYVVGVQASLASTLVT